LDDRCPEACGVFPVEDNCQQFVVCKQGVATVSSCPDGLLFDSDLNTCNKECRVNCSSVSRRSLLRANFKRWESRRAGQGEKHTTR
jgi:hypothetical protein